MVGEATAHALLPVVEACGKQIAKVEVILTKILPAEGASSWERHIMALKSFSYDRDIAQVNTSLEANIGILTYHQVNIAADLSRKSLPFRDLPTPPLQKSGPAREKPAFIVPFARDNAFVGREDVLTEVEQRLQAVEGRAALAGIGGVG